jgi:hypothetical protein
VVRKFELHSSTAQVVAASKLLLALYFGCTLIMIRGSLLPLREPADPEGLVLDQSAVNKQSMRFKYHQRADMGSTQSISTLCIPHCGLIFG